MSGTVGDGGTFGAALKPMVWRFSIESSWAAPFGRTKPVVSQVVGGQTDSSPPLNEAHCAAHQTFPRALCQKPHLSGAGFGELDPSADEDSTDGCSNHECDGKPPPAHGHLECAVRPSFSHLHLRSFHQNEPTSALSQNGRRPRHGDQHPLSQHCHCNISCYFTTPFQHKSHDVMFHMYLNTFPVARHVSRSSSTH